MKLAGFDAGLDVLGYTDQASFLINCGIGDLPIVRRDQRHDQDCREDERQPGNDESAPTSSA